MTPHRRAALSLALLLACSSADEPATSTDAAGGSAGSKAGGGGSAGKGGSAGSAAKAGASQAGSGGAAGNAGGPGGQGGGGSGAGGVSGGGASGAGAGGQPAAGAGGAEIAGASGQGGSGAGAGGAEAGGAGAEGGSAGAAGAGPQCPAPTGCAGDQPACIYKAPASVCPAVTDPKTPAQVDFAVGVSDSDPSSFTHPAWPALNVQRARAVVPYDVAQRPGDDLARLKFEAWRSKATAAGVEMMVALAPSQLRRVGGCGSALAAPDPAAYGSAFGAFHAAYPDVKVIAPWNEPNFSTSDEAEQVKTPGGERMDLSSCATKDVTHCGPVLAAHYYLHAVDACPDCTLVAGEFAASPGSDPEQGSAYWSLYAQHLGNKRPGAWGIHPHLDLIRYQIEGHHCQAGDSTCVTRTFAEFVNALASKDASWKDGHIWLDEASAYYRYKSQDGVVHELGETSQAQATAFLLRLPQISGRITRIYFYSLSNQCSTADKCGTNDPGLISPEPWDGSLVPYDPKPCHVRASFFKIRERDTSGP